jgi:outer membrane receptor for ferric coprogen and ferric-rhodotorulic acid
LLRTFTTYRLPGAFNKLTIGGGVNWQDSIYTYATNPAGNSEKIQQDASPDWRWCRAFFCSN